MLPLLRASYWCQCQRWAHDRTLASSGSPRSLIQLLPKALGAQRNSSIKWHFFCHHFSLTTRPSSGVALRVQPAICTGFLLRAETKLIHEEMRRPTENAFIVQLHRKFISTRMRKSYFQLRPTDVSSVSSQGRGGFRNGLHRTGHHDLGPTRRPLWTLLRADEMGFLH